ncbi:MAG: hypothetical protein Kow0077_28540 [Anaerolineae bacterium]
MPVTLREIYRLSLQLSPEERRQLASYLLDPPAVPDAREILARIEAHAADLRALGVRRLGLFGSHLRGDADPASDIDLLVALDGKPSMRGFMRIKRYLEELLGHPVDLVLEDSLREELRPVVLAEVVYAGGL